MGFGAAIGGIADLIGNLAGPAIADPGEQPGSRILPTFNPFGLASTQASLFDALGQIGFANPEQLLQGGPLQDLAARIQSLPMEEREKRRALLDIDKMRQGIPTSGAAAHRALIRLGLNVSDLNRMVDEQKKYEASVGELKDRFGPIQAQTVIDRLQTGGNISSLLAGATSQNGSGMQRLFREKFQREREEALQNAEDQLLMRSKFAGVNPAGGLEELMQQRANLPSDADIFAIEKALFAAAQASSVLNQGTAAAQGAAGGASNAAMNAAQIAANQAQAANSLSADLRTNASLGWANGLAGASQSLGDIAGGLFMGSQNQTNLGSIRPAFSGVGDPRSWTGNP